MWMNAVGVCGDKGKAFAEAHHDPLSRCGTRARTRLCPAVTRSVTPARLGLEGARAGNESLRMLLPRQGPKKYSDNLQICGVLVLRNTSKICYFENGGLIFIINQFVFPVWQNDDVYSAL